MTQIIGFVLETIDMSGSIYFINSDLECIVYEQKVTNAKFTPLESGLYKIKLLNDAVVQKDFITYSTFCADIAKYHKSNDWFVGLYASDYYLFLEKKGQCPFNVRPFLEPPKRNFKKYQFQLISRASA